MEGGADTLPVWAQWLFGSGAIGLILAFFAWALRSWKLLNGRLDSLEDSVVRIEGSLDQLRTQSNGHLVVTGKLVSSFVSSGDLSRDDISIILSTYTTLAQIPPLPNNPISSQEHQRLNNYIEMARQGQWFTPEQVEDYQSIVKKSKKKGRMIETLWRC